MRLGHNPTTRWLWLLMALPFLASSCSKDDEAVYNDYCYIKSVTLGNVKRVVENRDRYGNITSTINTIYSGSAYAMTIDQRADTIGNRDLLPYGSQLSRMVVTIAFDGSLLVYREYREDRQPDDDTGWVAYNSTDSLDLTKPLQLRVTSNDSQTSRLYKLSVNVSQQEGRRFDWKQCESGVTQLAGMTDMKAFVLNDKLMVLGQNGTSFTLAERSGIEANGTWTGHTTDMPAEADLQTLRQQGGTCYLSTSDGRIMSSTDAKTWVQEGTDYSAPLTLVEKTKDFFYAISGGKLLRSADASVWEDEGEKDRLDSEATFLPTDGIRALSVQQANGNKRIIMVGQNSNYSHSVVWNKMWNDSEKEADAKWMYFPVTPDNTIPCPRLQHLNLLSYDGKCIAFGGASTDKAHKALDAMYISQDYGITWRPSTELYPPIQLEGTTGCITSTVDKNNFIWIITNAQVWRGRLN